MYSGTECMEGESLCILELNAWKGILMYSGTNTAWWAEAYEPIVVIPN